MNKKTLTSSNRCHHTDNVEMVDVLIENGADVNNEDDNWRTPLMMAAGQGNRCKNVYIKLIDCGRPDKVLQLLIEKGAKVNAVDRDGRTALDIALETSQSEGKFSIY